MRKQRGGHKGTLPVLKHSEHSELNKRRIIGRTGVKKKFIPASFSILTEVKRPLGRRPRR